MVKFTAKDVFFILGCWHLNIDEIILHSVIVYFDLLQNLGIPYSTLDIT